MPLLPSLWKKYRLLIWLSVLLVIGFVTTSVASYIVSRDTIRRDIAEQGLPLTGDSIYSEIQKNILRPTFISSLMAHDTFVRDWILNGEKDDSQIVRYLAEIKQKYGTISSFLVSDSSRKYYFGGGLLKSVDPKAERDAWFFRVRQMRPAYEINVDLDMANHDAVTVFVNHRVLDYQGNFIGATGVGVTLDALAHTIDDAQKRFQRSIYFVAPDGKIVVAGSAVNTLQGSIQKLPGISSIAGRILNHSTEPTQLEYRHDHAKVLVNSRFIPELGWYLVVSQDERQAVKPLLQVFVANLAVSSAVTLLVLTLALFAVNNFQRRLEHTAAVDAMTGMLNRQHFEFAFEQARRDARRNRQPMSLILIDIDRFKAINDQFGHLAGDEAITGVAALIQDSVRQNDVLGRWGGEEFLILLKDCRSAQAYAIADKLRLAIAGQRFRFDAGQGSLSASMGVAEYRADESLAAIFARADASLYRAKSSGRNRVELATI